MHVSDTGTLRSVESSLSSSYETMMANWPHQDRLLRWQKLEGQAPPAVSKRLRFAIPQNPMQPLPYLHLRPKAPALAKTLTLTKVVATKKSKIKGSKAVEVQPKVQPARIKNQRTVQKAAVTKEAKGRKREVRASTVDANGYDNEEGDNFVVRDSAEEESPEAGTSESEGEHTISERNLTRAKDITMRYRYR